MSVGSVCARSLVTNVGVKIPASEANVHVGFLGSGTTANPVAKAPTADELLACPEGTVLAGSYSSGFGVGSQNSDQGRPGVSTKLYQSFTGCEKVITGVRFLGLFATYNQVWSSCLDRAGIDPTTFQMKEPLKVEVSFYKNKDGAPGDLVYKEEADVPGVYTNVNVPLFGDDQPIYSFTLNLKEEVKLYSGFVSFSAVDVGDSPSCWLCLFSCENVPGYATISMNGSSWTGAGAVCYCLLGDAGRDIAEKAMLVNRIISPTESSNSKYAKVQVEVANVGKNPVSDAALELWLDDKKIATENVGVTLANGEYYKYTFNARVDLSAEGQHKVVVKNATPGDEGIANQSVAVTTGNNVSTSLCTSQSQVTVTHSITRVQIGDIDNSSAASKYSDYRDQKASIVPGQTLPITIETSYVNTAYIKVYVDWNNNNSFDESTDFIGYYKPSEELNLTIPKNAEVTPGDHVLRVLISSDDASPCGKYGFGETEDYTLTVARPENSPALAVDKVDIDKTINTDSTGSDSFTVSNEGDAALETKVTIDYALPYSPNTRPVVQRAKPDFKLVKSDAPANVVAKAPKASDDVQHVLHYDRDHATNLGLNSGNEVTFAACYPGSTLAAIAGMKISSVDAWIQDVPQKASVVVYGQDSQWAAGKLLYSQEFTPTAASWNHIVLDKPVEISNQDLWIGIKFEGVTGGNKQIGVDAGPAISGFGDYLNIGEPKWWTLKELGFDSNVNIRANVTGERTPAISWLTADKTDFEVIAGSSEEVGLTLNTTGLDNTLYEALINVSSNDPLVSSVKIPVYLNAEKKSGIKVEEMLTAKVFVGSDKVVYVVSDKEVSYVFASDLNGSLISLSYEPKLDLSEAQKGVYIVKVVYADGTEEATPVAVR